MATNQKCRQLQNGKLQMQKLKPWPKTKVKAYRMANRFAQRSLNNGQQQKLLFPFLVRTISIACHWEMLPRVLTMKIFAKCSTNAPIEKPNVWTDFGQERETKEQRRRKRRRRREKERTRRGIANASVCKFLYCCCIKLKFSMQFSLHKTSENALFTQQRPGHTL